MKAIIKPPGMPPAQINIPNTLQSILAKGW